MDAEPWQRRTELNGAIWTTGFHRKLIVLSLFHRMYVHVNIGPCYDLYSISEILRYIFLNFSNHFGSLKSRLQTSSLEFRVSSRAPSEPEGRTDRPSVAPPPFGCFGSSGLSFCRCDRRVHGSRLMPKRRGNTTCRSSFVKIPFTIHCRGVWRTSSSNVCIVC